MSECNCDTGGRSGGQVHDEWCGGSPRVQNRERLKIQEIIEREHCAKLADAYAAMHLKNGNEQAAAAAFEIAAKIRSGE